ncbi:MAG: MbnP family protein [Bacteroidota bacterium]
MHINASAVLQKNITLVFHHQINNKELVLGDSVTAPSGETITIERFKYYVSNFSVTDTKGKTIRLKDAYFLVDESEPESKKINLSLPDMTIHSINFLLGVDSIRNVSGIQTGALDPLKGMFWTWNSGYIMAKMEGVSEKVQQPGHRFTYHIGGFRHGINTARMITLTLPQNNQTPDQIFIVANLNQWFKSVHTISIAKTPVCHTPGALAMQFADNYGTMFSITPIQ